MPKNYGNVDEILAETVKVAGRTAESILLDRNLAKLGDAYLNFVYSLATSIRRGEASGMKVSNRVLAEAMRNSGLRVLLPHRLSRHEIGGSAEAVAVYAVARNLISTSELLGILVDTEDAVNAFTQVFKCIREEWKKAENL